MHTHGCDNNIVLHHSYDIKWKYNLPQNKWQVDIYKVYKYTLSLICVVGFNFSKQYSLNAKPELRVSMRNSFWAKRINDSMLVEFVKLTSVLYCYT